MPFGDIRPNHRKASCRALLPSLKVLLDCFRLEKVIPIFPSEKWLLEIESTAEIVIYTRWADGVGYK